VSATTPAPSLPGDPSGDPDCVGTVDVLVVVGTDHHRFDRVVRWTDEWLRRRPGASALVQYGTSAAPTAADGRPLVPHAQLQELMRSARVVVSHGGPATITEIRKLGKLPVCVPRDPALDEHVDGHQQRFARRMGASGFVVLCESQEAFEASLDAAMEDPASFSVTADGEAERIAATVAAYGRILDGVIAASHRR
jgi:UDP-N-acetylglucosamine transferase subunit ALG13